MRNNFLFDDSPWSAGYFEVLPQGTVMDFGGSTPDYSGAIAQMTAAQQQAIAAQQQMFQQAAGYLEPWRTAGGGALGQWSGFMGIPGYGGGPVGTTPEEGGLAGTQAALTSTQMLQNWPGLQFLQEQGTQAQARLGAATGMMGSGASQKGAQAWGQNLALTYALQPYLSNLQAISGQGLGAAGSTAGGALQTGAGMAGTYTSMGQALANLYATQAQQQAAQRGSFMSDIFGGLGFLGGMALTPFTGGTSLLGSIGGGLSSLFGGGGGGGGGGYSTGGFLGSSMSPWSWKDDGGPVRRGTPYFVGGRGEEIFVPETDGYIIPNEAISYRYGETLAPEDFSRRRVNWGALAPYTVSSMLYAPQPF